MSRLSAVGVGDDAERLYRRALGDGDQPLAQHAQALGWTMPRTQAAYRVLVTEGLVRGGDGDQPLSADNPRGAITRLVERETLELERRRRDLDGVRVIVEELAQEHRAGRGDSGDSAHIEVLPPGRDVSTVENLLRMTTGVLRSAHLEVAAGPATDPSLYRLARAQMAQGRELRSVYPAVAMDDPAGVEWVLNWATAGERQRIVEAVPHEFVVFGVEAVVCAPMWGHAGGGSVVIRMPLVVQALTRVFEDAWAGGVPVPDRASGSDVSTRLLTLLAAGFKDEAIARYLGVGVRTVRRRVAETMDELGVHTRFQLGVAAERRALLGRGRRGPAVGDVR